MADAIITPDCVFLVPLFFRTSLFLALIYIIFFKILGNFLLCTEEKCLGNLAGALYRRKKMFRKFSWRSVQKKKNV